MFTRLSEHLIICIRQVFLDDITFVLEVASTDDDAVSLLTIEESHKNGPCSGAAALSCPVGHLDVAGGERDANLFTEDRTHLQSRSLAPWTLADSTSWSTAVGRSALSHSAWFSDFACSSFVYFLQRPLLTPVFLPGRGGGGNWLYISAMLNIAAAEQLFKRRKKEKKKKKKKKREKSRKIRVWKTRLICMAVRRLHNTTELLTKVAEIYLYITLPSVWQTHTLRAPLSGTFLQTLPDLVTPLKGYSLSPRSCPVTRSAPSERFRYW